MPAPPTVDEVNCLQANGADFLWKSICKLLSETI